MDVLREGEVGRGMATRGREGEGSLLMRQWGGRHPHPAFLSRGRHCQSIQRVMSLIHR